MSETASSPFEEPRTKRWVWIVPSVLLHVVILAAWLILPEPEPRVPGERELTIDAEQAEQLQEHVEDSKLAELSANLEELKKIRARMDVIRAGRMTRLQGFEVEMKQEAPQDMAQLVEQIVVTQQKVIELFDQMETSARAMHAAMPKARAAMAKNEAEGIRAIASLASVQQPLQLMEDQFEALYLETKANLRTIEQRLEWISDPKISERFAAYQQDLDQAGDAHRKAFLSVRNAYAGKNGRFLQSVAEDTDAMISSLKAFDEEVAAGKAKADKERDELQGKVDAADKRMKELVSVIAAEKKKLSAIDSKKERDKWRAQQQVIKPLESERGALTRQLKTDRRRVGAIRHTPDRGRQKSTQNTRGALGRILKAEMDPSLLEVARKEHEQVLQVSQDFISYLGGAS